MLMDFWQFRSLYDQSFNSWRSTATTLQVWLNLIPWGKPRDTHMCTDVYIYIYIHDIYMCITYINILILCIYIYSMYIYIYILYIYIHSISIFIYVIHIYISCIYIYMYTSVHIWVSLGLPQGMRLSQTWSVVAVDLQELKLWSYRLLNCQKSINIPYSHGVWRENVGTWSINGWCTLW